jgi:UDPglucose 6-dehydrogenase
MQVIKDLAGYEGLVICKSTASPKVYEYIESRSGLLVAHVPEFLTQANYVNDYLNPHKIVIGCEWPIESRVYRAIMNSRITFTGKVEFCSIGEASFFKYLANTMLAMKVVMNNEYYDLATNLGLDWKTISDIASTDPRLGNTHWQVPGPDGSRGFGGACFPKDTAALEAIAKDLGVELSMLSQSIAKNTTLRAGS